MVLLSVMRTEEPDELAMLSRKAASADDWVNSRTEAVIPRSKRIFFIIRFSFPKTDRFSGKDFKLIHDESAKSPRLFVGNSEDESTIEEGGKAARGMEEVWAARQPG